MKRGVLARAAAEAPGHERYKPCSMDGMVAKAETENRRGRLINGLAQALAVWAGALLVVYLFPHVVVLWAGLCTGL